MRNILTQEEVLATRKWNDMLKKHRSGIVGTYRTDDGYKITEQQWHPDHAPTIDEVLKKKPPPDHAPTIDEVLKKKPQWRP